MINQLCLFNETIKIPKVWDLESFQVAEPMEVLGGQCIQTGHGSSPPLPHTCPVPLIYLAVAELYTL